MTEQQMPHLAGGSMHIDADGVAHPGELTEDAMRAMPVTVYTLPLCTKTEHCHLPDDGHPVEVCEVDEDAWGRSTFDES